MRLNYSAPSEIKAKHTCRLTLKKIALIWRKFTVLVDPLVGHPCYWCHKLTLDTKLEIINDLFFLFKLHPVFNFLFLTYFDLNLEGCSLVLDFWTIQPKNLLRVQLVPCLPFFNRSPRQRGAQQTQTVTVAFNVFPQWIPSQTISINTMWTLNCNNLSTSMEAHFLGIPKLKRCHLTAQLCHILVHSFRIWNLRPVGLK